MPSGQSPNAGQLFPAEDSLAGAAAAERETDDDGIVADDDYAESDCDNTHLSEDFDYHSDGGDSGNGQSQVRAESPMKISQDSEAHQRQGLSYDDEDQVLDLSRKNC